MLVSVIVPTKNSSRTLAACLASVRAQTHGAIELIVVDNFSTDATPEIARGASDVFVQCGPERSAQRNEGVRRARGEYVAIIDSDMVLAPTVIAECVAALGDGAPGARAGGVIIPEESFGDGFWAQCKALERSFYVGVPWMEAARFFRRAEFSAEGGYDEQLVSGEDWDLSQRMAARFGAHARCAAFIRHDEGRLTFGGTLRKKKYYAQKFAAYAGKREHRGALSQQASPLRRYALFFAQPGKLFARPLVGLGMLALKTGEFAAGAVGLAGAARASRTVRASGIAENAYGPLAADTDMSGATALPVVVEPPVLAPGAPKLPVSVVVIIYREANRLARCLASVADLVDDIVVVHDGPCDDRSREVAAHYGARFIEGPRVGHAEGHRALTFREAKHDWIVQLDADERWSPELREFLPRFVAQPDADIVNAPWVWRHRGQWYPLGTKAVLFDKRKVYFIGSVHEYVKPLGRDVRLRRIAAPLLHELRADRFSEAHRQKAMRWREIHAREYLRPVQSFPNWNYPHAQWDMPNRVRLQYPLLLGVIATPLYHLVQAVKVALRGAPGFVVNGKIRSALYTARVFWLYRRLLREAVPHGSAPRDGDVPTNV